MGSGSASGCWRPGCCTKQTERQPRPRRMPTSSLLSNEHQVPASHRDGAGVLTFHGSERIRPEGLAPIRRDGLQAAGAIPPRHQHRHQMLRGIPANILVDLFNAGIRKTGINGRLAEGIGIPNRGAGCLVVRNPRRRGQRPVDNVVDDRPDRILSRRRGDTGWQPPARLEHPPSLAEGPREIGDELQAVPADRGIKGAIRKGEGLDVHDLEASIWDAGGSSQLDHPQGEVDPNHLAARRDPRCKGPRHVARTASEVEDPHPGPRFDHVDHALPAARLAARHDLVQSPLIIGGVAAEYPWIEFLGLQAESLFHSRSSQSAAPRVSALVLPATWIPTGSPADGPGNETTGCPVVLKGRVNRARGSRTSPAALIGGATIAVVGRRRASRPSMACWACRRKRGSAVSASSKSTASISSPRLMRAMTSAISRLPRAGLNPTTPSSDAGIRIEPPVSLPIAQSHMPVATATADPPDEPPATRLGSCGLRTGP